MRRALAGGTLLGFLALAGCPLDRDCERILRDACQKVECGTIDTGDPRCDDHLNPADRFCGACRTGAECISNVCVPIATDGGPGDGGAAGGGGGTDGGVFSLEPPLRDVSVASSTSATGPLDAGGTLFSSYSASALFRDVDGGTLELRVEPINSECRLTTQRGAGGAPLLKHAGVISITGGFEPVSLAPRPDGGGYAAVIRASSLFDGGETLSVSASGGVVAPFNLEIVAPSQALISAPAPYTPGSVISRSSPLQYAWSAGGSGTVNVTLAMNVAGPAGPTGLVLACEFPAARGNGTIPVEALQKLPPGAAGLTVRQSNVGLADAGGESVSVRLLTLPTRPDRTQYTDANVMLQ